MRTTLFLAIPVAMTVLGSTASAQVVLKHDPYSLTVEGYANLTAARNSGEDNAPNPKEYTARIDAGLRLLGLAKPEGGPSYGARIELLSSKEDALEVGDVVYYS